MGRMFLGSERASLLWAEVCLPLWSEPCSGLFSLFIQTPLSSGTLVSFHLPRPLSGSLESQAALCSFAEGGFWGSELTAHPKPLHMLFPGPGVPPSSKPQSKCRSF